MRPPQSFKLTTSKRSNSTRLPQGLNVATSKTKQLCEFLHLTTSKTKQFCETSSFFEVDNIKKETILRDLLQKWKFECRADGLVPIRSPICPLHLSKVLRLPRKRDARSYEVLHLSRKIILANKGRITPACLILFWILCAFIRHNAIQCLASNAMLAQSDAVRRLH